MRMFRVALLGGTLTLALSGPARAQDLITNGSFETGNLTGWSATLNGAANCDRDWNVSSSGGTGTLGSLSYSGGPNCATVPSPVHGTYAAYNSLDGNGPQNFTLKQSFVVPTNISSAELIFSDAIYADYGSETVPRPFRVFSVNFLDALNNVLFTPFSHNVKQSDSGPVGHGWTSRSFDVFSSLATHQGQTLQLSFNVFVPEYFTGWSGMGLDDVRLNVATADPGNTVTPEPVSLALLGTGLAGLGAVRRRRRAGTE